MTSLTLAVDNTPSLFRIADTPLRLHLEETTVDRLSRLGTRLDELIEEGYTPAEIRRHLLLVDAANDETY